MEVEDAVVAEVYVNLRPDPTDNEVLAFLHKTLGSEDIDVAQAELVAARPVLTRSDGLVIALRNAAARECVEEPREDWTGACFLADTTEAQLLRPGDLFELRIELADGGLLEGATRAPGTFQMVGVGDRCALPPDRLLGLQWTRSSGAWAYVNETAISGLPAALRREGIVLRDDPLYLLGLSVSDADTTITFPSEFGVFNRFDLDKDVAVRLQRGLPDDTNAEVTITAVDRNYVNWARGGNFNPSGAVRVASLRGDGTGVFGSTFGQRLLITIGPPGPSLPPCLPG